MSKSIFRQKCLKKLKKVSKGNLLYRNTKVNDKLYRAIRNKKRLNILFYYPLGIEVNIIKVLNLMRKNHNIYIPFMVEQSFKMVPFRLPLMKKKFGIFEAGNTYRKINNIDIAIVPVVGVDGNLQRVGFGKGMYDRFFENLQKKPYIIFIQLEDCYTDEYICDTYDIKCDLYLTPKKTIVRKNRN